MKKRAKNRNMMMMKGGGKVKKGMKKRAKKSMKKRAKKK